MATGGGSKGQTPDKLFAQVPPSQELSLGSGEQVGTKTMCWAERNDRFYLDIFFIKNIRKNRSFIDV